MKTKIIFTVILLTGLALASIVLFATWTQASNERVCPNSGEWTKIDSDDMTAHPVDAAVEYCYKDGDGRFFSNTPLDWTLNNEDEVIMEERSKGLSHWSYRIATPTLTPTATPSATLTPTATPSATPTATPVPTDTPKPTNTPTPQITKESWEDIRQEEGEVYGAKK